MSTVKNTLTSLRERLDKLEVNLASQADFIETREKRLHLMEKNIELYRSSESQKVMLNVGGIEFVTCKHTLLSIPDNLFTELLTKVDLSQEIYIERKGEIFRIILDYFRTKNFNYKHHNLKTLLELKEEAEFFRVDALYTELDNLTKDIELVSYEHSGNYVYKGVTAGTQIVDDVKNKDLTKGICAKSPGFITFELNGNWEFEEIEIAGWNGDTKIWYPGNGSGAKIYTSEDKEKWTQVGTVSSSYASKIVTCKLKRSQGRYLKFEHNSFVGLGYLFVKRLPLEQN